MSLDSVKIAYILVKNANLISLTKNLSPKNVELNVRAPRALIHIKSRIHGLRQLYIKGLLPNS